MKRARTKLPVTLPQTAKRLAGRTEAAATPAAFRASGLDLGPALRDHTRKHLGMKLGKFAPDIERVTVRVADVNGPKGGVDKVCRAKAVLIALPTVFVEQRDHDAYAAVDGALDRLERAVRKSLSRRREAPRVRARKAAARARRPGRSRRSSPA
jgi:ribosomal subunit interface protein